MQWVIALVVVAGALIWAWWAESVGETRAKGFCAGISVGSSIEDVADVARSTGDARLRKIEANAVTVGFIGIPPFSRHICDVQAQDGAVVTKRYVHLD